MTMRAPLLLLSVAAISLGAFAPVLAEPPVPGERRAKGSERLICRGRTETGSHVRRRRVCLTAEQWRRHDDSWREFGRQMQDDNRGAPNGGN